MIEIVAYIYGAMFIIAIIIAVQEHIKKSRITPEAKKNEIISKWGSVNPAYICPHCQTKGFVHTKPVKRKKGVSGAKVTGALFTAGVSILATGLSRKEGMTQAHCENCNSTWDF